MVVIYEVDDSRESTGSAAQPAYRLHFAVVGTYDDVEVHALVQSTIPAFYLKLIFQDYTIKCEGGDVWDVAVNYGRLTRAQQAGFDQGTPGGGVGGAEQTGFALTFDTTGGREKVTQAIWNTTRYGKPGEIAPDFTGAINVTKDSIEGVEIVVPTLKWSETRKVPTALVTFQYIRTLFLLTGTCNKEAFRGLEAGEALFLGCTGSQRDLDAYELTYHFLGSANIPNAFHPDGLPIGNTGITVGRKGGHEYLWVRFDEYPADDAKRPVKRATAAYVEQVYERVSWTGLQIGN